MAARASDGAEKAARKKPRRLYGSGTVYQRADGKWVGQLPSEYVGTSRRRPKVIGRTRADATDKLAKRLQQLARGEPGTPTRETVGHFLARWLEDVQRPIAAPSTYAQQEMLVRKHLIPGLGRHPLAELSAERVQAFYAAKHREERRPGQRYAPGYLRQMHAVLHHALATAEEWDLVPRNVAARTKRPRVE